MIPTSIDAVCPKCRHKFQLSLGKALTPLIDSEVDRRLESERQEIIEATRETAVKDSDERNRTAIAMRDKMIAGMRVQIDEMRRKADLGSQQVQGEVQQTALAETLRTAFPVDRVLPVETGCPGADAIHEVIGTRGRPAGAIIWESKKCQEVE